MRTFLKEVLNETLVAEPTLANNTTKHTNINNSSQVLFTLIRPGYIRLKSKP